jgi:VCBS repeat-containing protein
VPTPSALEAQLPPLRPFLTRGTAGFTPHARALSWLTVAGVLLVACNGGDGLLLPSEGQPAAIEVLRGDGQSGRVGEPLANPLVVEVTDTRNRPVEGATVTFELTSGGPGADVVPHTATTDANGQANAQIVLGTTIGQQTGEARVGVGTGTVPRKTTFTAMAVSENANNLAAVAGEDQTGHVSAPLDARLVVQVTDGFGNPIAGVPISWEAEGGGTVSDATVNTDDQGRASVERVLGPAAGQQTTVATSEGLAGSPVTFVHTALAGNAAHLAVVSGDNQTGQVGSQLPAELVVRLIDGDGNGVPNTAVAWVVATGGGSVTPTNSNTDSDGRASARWTLGGTLGANRLDAVVSGVGVATFDAMATAGAPAALSFVTQPSPSARNGLRFERQPVLQLRDADGNAVSRAGVPVSAAIGAGSGDLTGTRQRSTDANGRATFTDLAIVGSGRHTLVFSSSGYASTTSSDIDVGSIATTTTITSDTPDPSTSGSAFPVEFRVTSGGPTPTGSVTITVSDGGANCTGTLSGGAGSCQLILTRTGDRTLRAAYSGVPGFDPSTDTEGHRVDEAGPGNRAPHADYHLQCDGLTCQFTDASSDPDGQVTAWSWDFGDGSTPSTQQNPPHTYPAAGTYTVTLTATDNDGTTNAASAPVTVQAPKNKAPHAEFEVACPNPDLTCAFTDKSSDDDGNVTNWHWDFGDEQSSSDQSPSHTYAAPGTYHVTLTVTDNSGAPASKDHDAHPQAPPANQPPQAQGDAYSTNEDTPLTVNAPGVLGNDTDSEGSTLSAVNPVSPSHGTLALSSDGSFVYTPDANFNGTDSFTYQASDGSLLSGQATVTITINAVNDPPIAQADAYNTPGGDQALTVSAPGVLSNDSDPDAGTTLTAQDASTPSQGAVILSPDGSFTYTPTPGASGQDSFTYTASDGDLTSTATVTITIP